MLEIRDLVKTYGSGPRAVDGLTLSVNAGDIYGFIGHNGAGKTTTLKCISGILPFDSGEILVDGIDVNKNPMAAKRIMRYIPDNPDLYTFVTGEGYLNFLTFTASTKRRGGNASKNTPRRLRSNRSSAISSAPIRTACARSLP